jgi:hypothetical protein
VDSAGLSIRHLREFFGLSRAIDLTADRIETYVRPRQLSKLIFIEEKRRRGILATNRSCLREIKRQTYEALRWLDAAYIAFSGSRWRCEIF